MFGLTNFHYSNVLLDMYTKVTGLPIESYGLKPCRILMNRLIGQLVKHNAWSFIEAVVIYITRNNWTVHALSLVLGGFVN